MQAKAQAMKLLTLTLLAGLAILTASSVRGEESEYIPGVTVNESTAPLPGQWLVVTSSPNGLNYFTLSEFVKSGKFCRENGGHRWFDEWKYTSDVWLEGEWRKELIYMPRCGGHGTCIICRRCRQLIKVNKVEEVWEP